MATRKPLVVVSGFISELPPNDGIEGAAGVLTAGSGLLGGGSLTTNQRIDVGLASNPSGLILVGNNLGLDGVAQRTADTALSSGNAALSSAATAQASGNAALPRAGGTMTGKITFVADQQIDRSVNLSGGVSGAVPYQTAPNTTSFLSPGTSGQVLTTQGAGQIPSWTTPGKILQVVQYATTVSGATTGSAFLATSISGSITPSSTSSRIFITGMIPRIVFVGAKCNASILRNNTNLGDATNGFWEANDSAAGNKLSASLTYIDSPATTSGINYALALKGNTSYGSATGVSGTIQMAIILAEIGP